MKKLIGTCNTIDWKELFNICKNTEPAYVGPRHTPNDNLPGVDDVWNKWNTAGYKLWSDGGTIGWDMYFPKVNFDWSVVEQFSDYVNVDPVSCWISGVHPGYFAPIHWDTQDNEEELRKGPEIYRFHAHLHDTSPGHVLIVEDDIYYNCKQGEVYQWPSRHSWHAGSNCGYETKYIFNFFGHPR